MIFSLSLKIFFMPKHSNVFSRHDFIMPTNTKAYLLAA